MLHLRIAILACAGFAALAIIDPAAAQSTRAAQERACGHDVSRYCRRYVSEGDNAVYNCLVQVHDRLSAACRRVVDGH